MYSLTRRVCVCATLWISSILFVLTTTRAQTLLASSTLQQCTANASTIVNLQCSSKIVAFLAVPSNSLGSNVLDFRITCTSPDPTQCTNGKCTCNYARDPGCRCRELADNGLFIRLRKTPALLHYPLTYITSYNARPYEEYIMTGCWAENRLNGPRDCRDDDQQPTCGIYTYHNPMTDTWTNQSTGFCCQCTMTDYHNNAKIVRADGLDCQTPVKRWNNLHATCRADQGRNRVPPGTAHCMRFDPNEWYEGFRVGPYQQRFAISALLMSQQRSGRVEGEVVVGPDRRVAVGGGARNVLLSLVGDFAGYQELQSLAGRVLFVPSGDIEDMALARDATFRPTLQGEWIILPDTLVGTGECRKIGTTLTAFRNQAPRGGGQRLHPACLRDRDCLAYEHQLGRFVDDDRGRQSRGQPPLYMLSGLQGPVVMGSERMVRTGGGVFSLQLPVVEPGNSGVVLEVAADSVRFVTVTSPARIVDAVGLCDFNGRNCGAPFEALRETRYLTLTVQNTGTQPSDYYVGLVNCSSEHVMPPLQRLVSLAPSATTHTTFDMRITSDQAAQYGCIATIQDTRGAVLDRRLVTFNVTATAYDPKPLELVGAAPGVGGPNSSTSNPYYDPFGATADGGGGELGTGPIDASNERVQEVLRRRSNTSVTSARGGVNSSSGGGAPVNGTSACAALCKGVGDVGCNLVHRCTGPLVLYSVLVVGLGLIAVGIVAALLLVLFLHRRRLQQQAVQQAVQQGPFPKATHVHHVPAAVHRGSLSSSCQTPPRRRTSRARVRSSST